MMFMYSCEVSGVILVTFKDNNVKCKASVKDSKLSEEKNFLRSIAKNFCNFFKKFLSTFFALN